ncbi:hypothetical protein GJ744_003467 [Endocarpon pusillum]|uniref:EKC/KEOPS complex subunit GON7 n=1 Tax=Endocarpon pusillum TaxID=364733 RepID=A0A8H7E9H8_9EURO|nr:hypothetical protein GJ744_003467 [Endocarpon pusillum]
MADPAKATLGATYTSPSSVKTFTNPISAPFPSSETPTAVKDKVSYLSELRASTKQLQEEINVFLTQKMQEDTASARTTGTEGHEGGSKKGEENSKDELMEEDYGEEEIGDEED